MHRISKYVAVVAAGLLGSLLVTASDAERTSDKTSTCRGSAPRAVMLTGSAFAQPAHDHGSRDKGRALGEVQFQTSCSLAAHRRFNDGMLYQHSFWYRAAKQAFDETLQADAQCAIAYWGIAQSLLLNPFGPPSPKNLADGLAALEKGEASGAGSEREQDFIRALKTFFAEHKKRSHRERLQLYVKAMGEVAARYPQDDEAQIYYALALNVAASPTDKTYALPLKAAALLEPIFHRKPQHPGVAHYLVHSYDYPPIAEKGIEAARRYAAIAGSSPHALHMPSHIFTRVGHWRESIASNLISAKTAKDDNEPDDQLHAMDYLVYAHLQLAQDEKAREALEEMRNMAGVNMARHTGPFALAASAARYTMELGDWTAAARLPVSATRFGHVDAISHFARAIGAARSGSLDAAKTEIAKLNELSEKLRGAGEAYWAEQVDIQRQVAEAWALYAQDKHQEALHILQAAADAEDRTDKHVVTPGPLIPSRELYGAMLLSQGQHREALAAFEATLQKEPNRLGAMLGAAKAAEQGGSTDRARHHYQSALTMVGDAGASRPELSEARLFLSRRR